MKKKSGLIAGIVILILLCIGAGVLYQNMKPAASEGEKHITVTVIHGDQTENVFEFDTDAKYLGEVLEARISWTVSLENMVCLLQLWMKKQRMIPNNNGGVSQKAENRSTLPQIRHQFLTEMHLSLH